MKRILKMSTLETPPRAWGRRGLEAHAPAPDRNTPTCVGKTCVDLYGVMIPQKHPHVRGEDSGLYTPCLTSVETPPRAWGRLLRQHSVLRSHGNTPTCVGKTFSRATPARVAGETPPRAWGRRALAVSPLRLARNTPTCVGKTQFGEGSAQVAEETPPRAWGRLKVVRARYIDLRNTPTCVGKTE